MQKPPDWKGTGLVPIKTSDETSDDKVVHVFGKNLEERVITGENNQDETSAALSQQILSSQDKSESTSRPSDEDIETFKKRKFDAITGEEDEVTIFQGDFKLFSWDLKTSNWIERGRGKLRLNDDAELGKQKSRLIMRLGGTLRIVLNVSINHSYFRVMVSSKTNIRFTDGPNLWAAGGNNALQLKDLIEERLTVSRKQEIDQIKKVKSTPTKEISSTLEESTQSKEKPVEDNQHQPEVNEDHAKKPENDNQVEDHAKKPEDDDLVEHHAKEPEKDNQVEHHAKKPENDNQVEDHAKEPENDNQVEHHAKEPENDNQVEHHAKKPENDNQVEDHAKKPEKDNQVKDHTHQASDDNEG